MILNVIKIGGEEMIKFTVPGEPQGKARARTVRLKTGKVISYTPEKTELYENWIKSCFLQQCGNKKLSGELDITIVAYYRIPKNPKKPDYIKANIKPKQVRKLMEENKIRPAKKPDFDNISKVVADSLNSIAFKDDAAIVEAKFEKYYSNEPRVEVIITKTGLTEEWLERWLMQNA
jgi:Holliday junction resolvase RusA-like endonuclease